MSTWLSVLVGAGVVILVAGLSYVVWRWGGKRSSITKGALMVSTFILGFVKSFLKDDPEKLDAFDFVSAGEVLSTKLTEILGKHTKGLSFLDTKVEMVAAVKEMVSKFPDISDKLTDEVIEKEVEGALMLISGIPKVRDIVKK